MGRGVTTRRAEVVVVGAGPAGLATAAMLKRQRIRAIVVERSSKVAASWRKRYDALQLNTSRIMSRLPGYSFSWSDGVWPSRDGVINYLERYVHHHALDITFNTEVQRIERNTNGWTLQTSRDEFECEFLVIATGTDQQPCIPEWPGRDGWNGSLLHSSEYVNPLPYRGQHVLVVGAGNSAVEIALDLLNGGAARVDLSIRTPPYILLRSLAGIPADWLAYGIRRLPPKRINALMRIVERLTIGDLSEHGLKSSKPPFYDRLYLDKRVPVLDTGEFVRAVKTRSIKILPAIEKFGPGRVELVDGSSVEPDAVVAATGYRPGLEALVGHLGVLDSEGFPLGHGDTPPPGAQGLFFIGFQYGLPGLFRENRVNSKKIDRKSVV
jgi:putative flavoprotein involved in K+ transport